MGPPSIRIDYSFMRSFATRQSFCVRATCSNEHEKGARHELVGKLHGLENGYADPEGIAPVYRRGRLARHRLGDSIRGRGSNLLKIELVLRKYVNDLPAHLTVILWSQLDIIRES